MSKQGQADVIELGKVGGGGSGKSDLLPADEHDSTRDRTTSFSVRRVAQDGGFESSTQGDTLQSTKEYYGLNTAPQPSPSRDTSRLSHTRTLSMSTRFSSASRPKSPDSTMSHGTKRNQMPLPLHRGFLTPKKPSMSRLDGEGRKRTSSRQSFTSNHTPSRLQTSTLPLERPIAEGRESVDQETALRSVGAGHGSSVPGGLGASGSGNDSAGVSPVIATFGGNAPRQRDSVAEVSTHGGTQMAEASSDDLVEDQHDLEKGSHTLSNSHRKSHLGRKSSSRNRSKDASQKAKKRYQTFDNPLTSWYAGGRIMVGGDKPWSVLVTLVLLFGITGVWLGTSGVWYWRYGDQYGLARGAGIGIVIVFAYLFGLLLSSFLAAALRDPGIIPRDLDPIDLQAENGDEDNWDGPLDRQFAVKAGTVTVRYCDTCRSYRPPRGSHCRLCGNCVDGIDHHCSYIHTCVGKRTYFSFLVLITTAAISVIYEVIFSAIHFHLLCRTDSISFGTALSRSPGAAVSFLLGVLILPAVLFLLYYHARLVMYNITTVELIRASHSTKWYKSRIRPNNPFEENTMASNILLATWARPQFPSWVQADKAVQVDKREVNPALTEGRWVRGGYGSMGRRR